MNKRRFLIRDFSFLSLKTRRKCAVFISRKKQHINELTCGTKISQKARTLKFNILNKHILKTETFVITVMEKYWWVNNFTSLITSRVFYCLLALVVEILTSEKNDVRIFSIYLNVFLSTNKRANYRSKQTVLRRKSEKFP